MTLESDIAEGLKPLIVKQVSLEKKLVDVLDPVITDIVSLEKKHERLEDSFKSLGAKLETLTDEVRSELDDAFTEKVDAVKHDFAETIKKVKSLLDENLGVIAKQSRDLAAQQEIKEMAAVHFLVAEASLYGA